MSESRPPPPRSGHPGRAGSGRGVNRYTEACLLLLLAERPGHGYELAERLVEVLPLPELAPDLSSVYRVITELEGQGAIRSSWTAGSGGGRKFCQLTDDGWALLRFWEQRFRAEQKGLVRFFDRLTTAGGGRLEDPRRTPDAPPQTASAPRRRRS
ncbi:MAG: PadR family transcriptional regulator [Acidimicrobiales bacterium]